jgi:anti-sigma factor RsiW
MSHVDDGSLHAYLDGELPPVERERLEAHVAECPTCRAQLEEERALVERASQLLGLAQPVERPTPPLHQLRQPRLVWRLRVPLAWAASVVLAVGFGYYLGGNSYLVAPRQFAAERLQEPAAPATAPAPPAVAAPPAEGSRPSRPAALREGFADRNAAKANDSISVTSGVVAIEESRGLRPANPAPVPNAAVVIVDGANRLAEVRGRLGTTQWPIIRPGPARELLGTDPVAIPGLAVRNLRRSPAGDGVVLVEQLLDSTTVIQLYQQRADVERAQRALDRSDARVAAPPPAARAYAATERLARFVGTLRVEIAGPLTADSLNKLLEQLKPIP